MNGPHAQPSALERRYRRLLRAYPPDYRAERGPEILGTYLDLAGPGRRWPSPADAADLLRGGLRQRLRAAGTLGLLPGVRVAATLALTTAATLAVVWLAYVEMAPPAPGFAPTLGAVAWAAWIAVAVLAAAAPGRWSRLGVAIALAVTVAMVPASALTGYVRPPLYVLLPQVALGVVVLAMPDRPRPWQRLAPLAGATTATITAVLTGTGTGSGYGYLWIAADVLGAAALALLAGATLAGLGYGLRRDSRGVWAALVLLTPISLLALRPIMRFSGDAGVTRAGLGGMAVVVTVFATAVLLLSIMLRGRPHRAQGALPARCPACGHLRRQ